jgi:hypothetical protein
MIESNCRRPFAEKPAPEIAIGTKVFLITSKAGVVRESRNGASEPVNDLPNWTVGEVKSATWSLTINKEQFAVICSRDDPIRSIVLSNSCFVSHVELGGENRITFTYNAGSFDRVMKLFSTCTVPRQARCTGLDFFAVSMTEAHIPDTTQPIDYTAVQRRAKAIRKW